MIRIHRDMEYALLALLYMDKKNELVSARELAEAEGIPEARLKKLLQKLARGGVVEALQGAYGGYRLAANLSTLRLGQVAEALKDSSSYLPCDKDTVDCKKTASCKVRSALLGIIGLIEENIYSLSVGQVFGGLDVRE
ncbi:Rrf2 family transcriptional regulator [Spirochaetia bacterium 38H-sp]|uniref:Rrf2 family transcriptional regulator n=1 Tax=Rarispira pelagica TaxID=3141764 RepID=A0ABU9UF24_9SPIR